VNEITTNYNQMKIIIILIVSLVTACSSTQKNIQLTDVMNIIKLSSERAPNSVDGEFVLYIQAIGSQGKRVYLNTELDYRDRRNLTVALSSQALNEFRIKHDKNPKEYLLNKKIRVKGKAKQVKIWFFSNGKRTEKYYYQTHIQIDSLNQIEIIE
jgi:hypothetical protein